MVIATFTYRLCQRVLFKKLVRKQPKARKDMMERVHHFMGQEEVASEKIESD